MSDEPTGEELIQRWGNTQHRHPKLCPSCTDPISTVGITKLAYTFEVCECGTPEFSHLVETIWHRACLRQLVCTEFTPFYVKGRRGTRAHLTLECHVCGRTERSHHSADQGKGD